MAQLPRVSLWVDAALDEFQCLCGVGVVVIEQNGDRVEHSMTVRRVRESARAELHAACEALRLIEHRPKHHVLVYSDCAYVIRGEDRALGDPDLWGYIWRIGRRHTLEFIKVPGHANVEPNEQAHKLARLAIGKRP